MNKLKIAFIVERFPALSETFILNQITGLLEKGHDVDIFAKSSTNEIKVHMDVKKYNIMSKVCYFDIPTNIHQRIIKGVYIILKYYKSDLLKILKLLNIFKYGKYALTLEPLYVSINFIDKEYDIIHCHFGYSGKIGEILKYIGVKGKIITVFHGYDLSSEIKRNGMDIYRNLFVAGDLFLPVSNYWKKKLIGMGCPKSKIIVHQMGINIETFKYSIRDYTPNRQLQVLTIGRLVEKKGVEYAIRAIAKVSLKYNNIIYTIAGDGPLRNKIEALIEELGIHTQILGSVESTEVLQLYKKSGIFLLPSVTAEDGDQEGIPVVLMEAQATGLPIISTHHSGIPEVVLDGESGYLVPERDIDALADKLTYLIEHPNKCIEMGKRGRNHIESNYNIEKLNEKQIGIYSNLINSSE